MEARGAQGFDKGRVYMRLTNDMTGVIYCGECRDFLYEDTSGYGICGLDNELHSCREICCYKQKKHGFK